MSYSAKNRSTRFGEDAAASYDDELRGDEQQAVALLVPGSPGSS